MFHVTQRNNSLQLGRRAPRAALYGVLFGVLGALVWGSFADEAEARPRILRPGTRPAVYMGGIGGDIGLNHGGGDLVIHNTLGYHFSGDSSGPALGGDLDLLIGGGFGMALGPRFWYDIQIAGMSIYIAPYVRPALVLLFGAGAVEAAVNIQFGVRGKVILNNRAVLFLEFPGIGINIAPTATGTIVSARLRMMFGAGVTF